MFDDYTVSSGVTLLSSKTDIMYFGANDSVEAKTNYTYNNNQLLSKTETIDGNSNLTTNYYYPDDYNAVQNFSILRDPGKNIIAIPVDVRTYKDSQLISGNQTKYNNDGQPTDIYMAEPGNGITDISFDAGLPYRFSHKGTYSYNTRKRVKQESPDDNITTAYLWDANGTYVMAKVENAIHSQIIALDGKDCTYNSGILYNSLKSLVPGAMITTFSYKPLVGMTSQTGPDGRTIYYEYDDFGRLQYTRDNEGKILNKYRYHYAEQYTD
jgi:YD repeat-containing protein